MDYFSQQLEKEPKEPEETNGFFTSLRAMHYAELQIRTARSRGTFFALLSNRLSSGAREKLMRRGVKKTCRGHVFSLRSRRLCRRSIYLELHRKT